MSQKPKSCLHLLLERISHNKCGREDRACAEMAKDAHKFLFDIDDVVGEDRSSSMAQETYRYAIQLAKAGLFNLPFDTVVFEVGGKFTTPADKTCAAKFIVAWRQGEDIFARCYFWDPHNGPTANPVTCIWTGVCGKSNSLGIFESASMIRDEAEINLDFCPTQNDLAASTFFLCACVALLNIGSGVKIIDIPEPKFTNQLREKKMKPRIYAHSIVTVDYEALKMPGHRGAGTHASPRIHWRRGHLRNLPNGQIILVKACIVGAPNTTPLETSYKVKGATAKTLASRAANLARGR